MTALETMKEQLRIVQLVQLEQLKCISNQGYIYNHSKYHYIELCRKADDIKKGIEYLRSILN